MYASMHFKKEELLPTLKQQIITKHKRENIQKSFSLPPFLLASSPVEYLYTPAVVVVVVGVVVVVVVVQYSKYK